MNLKNIISSIYRAKTDKDSYPKKKVLVLEGGGMRGIFLTGVLQSFTDRQYFPWDLIIGSSAGALTGTAYAAGQIHLARDAFFHQTSIRKIHSHLKYTATGKTYTQS